MAKITKYSGGRAVAPYSMQVRRSGRGMERAEVVGYATSIIQRSIVDKAITTGEAVAELVSAFESLVVDMPTDELSARRYQVQIFEIAHTGIVRSFEGYTDAVLDLLDEVKWRMGLA